MKHKSRCLRVISIFTLLALCTWIFPEAVLAVPEYPVRVSVDSSNIQANNYSQFPSISADGRYIAFESYADNLIEGDTNSAADIFVYDQQTRETVVASVYSDDIQANNTSYTPSISADGRYVAFASSADNLADEDTNGAIDIFVYDQQARETVMASVCSDGSQADRNSGSPSISADGRYIAFQSYADNLVTGDSNNAADIFVYDQQTSKTVMASVYSDDIQANNTSFSPSISSDGRYVAFTSYADNLAAGDTNNATDIFVYDLQTRQTVMVSVASDGSQANSNSSSPSISADGRYVTFASSADNLVAGDTNNRADIFVYDLQTRQTVMASIASDGSQANSNSSSPSISADGRYVAFASYADNLVAGDTNDSSDIFIYDLHEGTTLRGNVTRDGNQANWESSQPSISADGGYVAFASYAGNLVPGDTNYEQDVFVITAADIWPPVFLSGYPQKVNVTENNIELLINSSENGKAYYVVLPEGAPEPSAAQVKAGQDSSSLPVADNLKGEINLTAFIEASANINMLAATTACDIYVVAEDTVQNLQAKPFKALGASNVAVTADTDAKKQIQSAKTTVTMNDEGYYAIMLNPDICTMYDGEISDTSNIDINDSTGLQSWYDLPIDEFVLEGNTIKMVRTNPGVARYTLRLSIVNATKLGGYMQVAMEMENLMDTEQELGTFIYWDTMIDDEDGSPFEIITNGWRNFHPDKDIQVSAFFKDTMYTTNADAIWMGEWDDPGSSWNDNPRMTWEEHAAGINEKVESDDTAAAVWYDPVAAAPGQSIKAACIIGAGPKNEPPVMGTTNLSIIGGNTYHPGEEIIITGQVSDNDEAGNIVDIMCAIDENAPALLGRLDCSEGPQNFSYTYQIPAGLTAGDHILKLWVRDEAGSTSQLETANITIPADTTPPKFAVGYPQVNNIGNSSFDLLVKANESGKAYYVLLNDGESEPSVSDIVYYKDGVIALGADTEIIRPISGLTSNTSYDIYVVTEDNNDNRSEKVKVDVRTSKSSSSSTATKLSDTDSEDAKEYKGVLIVDGKEEQAAEMRTEKQGDSTVTTITLNAQKVGANLSEGSTVTIPVSKEDSDIVVGELNGSLVEMMENRQAVVQVQTSRATYTLPAEEINIGAVAEQLGKNIDLKDITVSVEIAEAADQDVRVIESAARDGNLTLVVPPVSFKVNCTYGGKELEVSRFNNFVERLIAIPEGVDPSKITTGVVLNSDGTFSHVPTQIIVSNGVYYAKINSMTNSIYSVIWNPVKFADVADHWAKEAVNDMGSRLVISGYDNDTFRPDQDITRAEFAKIITTALGLRDSEGNMPYSDVARNAWYYNYVRLANDYGLIKGYPDGSFKPENKITREEAMAIINKAMIIAEMDIAIAPDEAAQYLNKFKDGSEVGNWAKTSAALGIKTGIVSGFDGKINPKDNVSRAETATMVRNLLQKVELI